MFSSSQKIATGHYEEHVMTLKGDKAQSESILPSHFGVQRSSLRSSRCCHDECDQGKRQSLARVVLPTGRTPPGATLACWRKRIQRLPKDVDAGRFWSL